MRAPFFVCCHKRLLHSSPFICSPLHACEESPFSLIVPKPWTNNPQENQGSRFPLTATGISGGRKPQPDPPQAAFPSSQPLGKFAQDWTPCAVTCAPDTENNPPHTCVVLGNQVGVGRFSSVKI